MCTMLVGESSRVKQPWYARKSLFHNETLSFVGGLPFFESSLYDSVMFCDIWGNGGR